jgi:hypothetical protein
VATLVLTADHVAGAKDAERDLGLARGLAAAASNSQLLNAALANYAVNARIAFPPGDWYFAEDTQNANINGTCLVVPGKGGFEFFGGGQYRPDNEPPAYGEPAARLIYAGPRLSLASLTLSVTGARGQLPTIEPGSTLKLMAHVGGHREFGLTPANQAAVDLFIADAPLTFIPVYHDITRNSWAKAYHNATCRKWPPLPSCI